MLLAHDQQQRGEADAAAATLKRLTALWPDDPAPWRALGDLMHCFGDTPAADAAYLAALRASVGDPLLIEAATALQEGRLEAAECALRGQLKVEHDNPPALRLLAEVAARQGRDADCVGLLTRCLTVNPSFHEARRAYALAMLRLEQPGAALVQVDHLLALAPQDPGLMTLKAGILVALGEAQAAAALYADALARHPRNPDAWLRCSRLLEALGRTAESAAAYRKAVEQAPHLSETARG
jgi:predicted Zn-dependent protease